MIFAAASLARAFSAVEEQVESSNRRVDVRLEISGSQTACRKVAELNREADLVATADDHVIDAILRPDHASFTIRFATNEIVLAHLEHSPGTERISASNWPEVLLSKGVKLGAVDPNQAPIGYRTRLVWKLAEGRFGPDLSRRLDARVADAHRMPHEGQLVQLLRSRVIDYAFVYRSTAEDQNLKLVALPAAYNLGSTGEAERYGVASVSVSMRAGEQKAVRGRPIFYGLTIPKGAQNTEGATLFVEELLGIRGRRALEGAGFTPLQPARCAERRGLPPRLARLMEAR